MSYELVNRITLKKNGVYISSHSNNDTASFYSHKHEYLSRLYKEEGKLAFEAAMIKFLLENCELRGDHQSVVRYRELFASKAYKSLLEKKEKNLMDAYHACSSAVQAEIDAYCAKSNEAKAYFALEQNLNERFYRTLAKLLPNRTHIPIQKCNEFYLIENDKDKAYGVSYISRGEADLCTDRFYVSDITDQTSLAEFEEYAEHHFPYIDPSIQPQPNTCTAINAHMDWWMQAPLTRQEAENIPQYSFSVMLDVLKAGFDAPRAIFLFNEI